MHEIDIYLSYKNINYSSNKSFWEPISEDQKNFHIKMLKLNFKLLKRYFKNIYLVTDSDSVEKFDKIGFSDIYIALDNMAEDYLDNIPAIFKLYVYNFISNKNKPFLHLDNDFFILDDIKPIFLESQAVAQSLDLMYNMDLLRYNYNILKYCKNKYDYIGDVYGYYNCGIIGGTDYRFFQEYSSSAIKFILDPENDIFWKKFRNGSFFRLSKSVLAEQVYYTSCINKYNIKIELVTDKKYNHKFVHHYGFQKEKYFKNIDQYIQNVDLFTCKY